MILMANLTNLCMSTISFGTSSTEVLTYRFSQCTIFPFSDTKLALKMSSAAVMSDHVIRQFFRSLILTIINSHTQSHDYVTNILCLNCIVVCSFCAVVSAPLNCRSCLALEQGMLVEPARRWYQMFTYTLKSQNMSCT